MPPVRSTRIARASLFAVLASPMALAQQPAVPRDLAAEIKVLKSQLEKQREQLERLQRQVDAQAARPGPAAMPSTDEVLEALRGTSSKVQGAVAASSLPATLTGPLMQAAPAAASGAARPAAPAANAPAAPAPRQAATGTRQTVGKPAGNRPPEVAPLFEQPGVLTPRGKFVLEPSLQFGYASSNRVALVGYTIIPALLIGLVDVREVKRNTTTFALTGRMGITNRMEAEARVPYIYRSDSTVSREIFTGTAVERVFDTSGRGLGDVEVGGRYQLNNGGADRPYYIAGLKAKTRTGQDPFEVVTDCTRRCVGENVTGTGLPLELPTGSGFYSLQPSLTFLLPADPAIFFGSVSYLHNFKRKNVRRTVLGGEKEFLGEVKPGDVFGFNFGIGLALNDRVALSLGYDHQSVGRVRQGGNTVPGSVRTQLGTLLLGYSYRVNEKRTINLAVGAGVTRDTPDVSLTLRVPFTF